MRPTSAVRRGFRGSRLWPVKSDSFGIEPIKAKKVVIPVFGRNTDASLGIFKLKGDRDLLNLLYMAGIGARRSEGKGKFDILA